MTKDPQTPLTEAHLRAACAWAQAASDEPQPIDGTTREYDQNIWDCGSACCIHGAAHILARGIPTPDGPFPSDMDAYLDLPSGTRQEIFRLLWRGDTTPEDILAVLDQNKEAP